MSDASDPAVPFESLLRHRDWVRALARRLVSDRSAADDVEQETWLEALRHPPRHATSARGWLGTVVRNAARKFGRGAARRTKYETAAPARDPDRPADDLVAEAEVGKRLVELVLALDEPYRGTVLLRWFDGLDPHEIATRTGTPVETVRTRLKRAATLLRERMDERHGGRTGAWAVALVGSDWKSVGVTEFAREVVMGTARKAMLAAAVVIGLGGAVWFTATGVESRETQTSAHSDSSHEGASRKPRRDKPAAALAVASTDDEPSDPSLRIDPNTAQHVKVLAADGTPLEDATVEFHRLRESDSDSWAERVEGFGAPDSPDAKFRTGPDGAVTLPRVADGKAWIVIRRRGYSSSRHWGALPAEVVLLRGCELTGRVLDLRGQAVAGATVIGSPAGVVQTHGGSTDVAKTTSATDGRFTLEDVPPGALYVFAGWPGGIVGRVAEVVVPSTRDIDVTLRGGGTIAGTVTEDGTGAPVEGATVAFVIWGDGRTSEPGFGVARTDAAGAYRIVGFTEETWQDVRVSKTGWYEPPRDYDNGRKPVPPGETTRVDRVLRRGGRVTGRVLGPDGPVPDATVTALGTKEATELAKRRATTDARGAYALDGLPPGRTALVVAAKGHLQEGFSGRWSEDVKSGSAPDSAFVEVRAGEAVTKDIVVSVGVEVSGRVLGPDGAPASGAHVYGHYTASWEPDGPLGLLETETDAAGEFVLRGVASGKELTVSATGDRAGSATTKVTAEAPGGARDVVLRLVPTGVLHVRVTWPDGPAPTDAVYYVGTLGDWVVQSGDRAKAFESATPHRLPADGRFDEPLRAEGDPLVIRVIATGFGIADSEPVPGAGGASEASTEIRLRPEARLSGRVSVQGGDEPVAAARLRLHRIDSTAAPRERGMNGGRSPVAATTGTRGEFELRGISPGGRYEVEVDAAGFEPWKGTTELPSEPLKIALSRLGVLAGRVHFADGKPAVGVTVWLAQADYSRTVVSDVDGRFRFDDAPPRPLGITASVAPDGGGANVVRVRKSPVQAGEDVDLVVEPALAISGTLLSADGRPFPPNTARVEVFPEGRGVFASASVAVGPDGSFLLRGLTPAKCRVAASGSLRLDDAVHLLPSVEGIEAGATGVALVARTGLAVEGVVELPSAAAGQRISVVAHRPEVRGLDARRDNARSSQYVGTNGRFRIEGLDSGRWRLVVQSNGNDSAWQAGDAAVVEAGASGVRLTLSTASTISGRLVYQGAGMVNCYVSATAVGDEKDACTAMTASDGGFTFVGLDPSKRWNLVGRYQELAPAQAAGVVMGTTDVRLELTAGLTIRGRVLRADGTAAAKLRITFQRVDGQDERGATCDERGEFEALGIAAGDFIAKTWIAGAKEGEPGVWWEIGRCRAGDAGVELRLTR